ncbi:hypothetical protein ISF_08954 [Cordyceps fumosorosea ARSEF 2679]|uniref:HET-s/LopB domain protein n=1 Tax=Cordyceps fumosorosea (strain ARSEF 2679) TaxID=1081104 RepID=A0A167LLH1_CORFA|nr:hypothetical protein ISF_08954 [Cordyceps fumosorosea ARSEF 2679]OAA53222.1 hypothetical protein ISF_08954 [Cordyceps fumosorosea ARSEF 2679]
METLLPPGGFQLPFRNSLSRLYNDTKKSSDFVQAPVPREKQQDPDAAGLHRKLRIQKDRLVGWGLEWSDPAAQTAEIDESLSRAGLAEVVASIMSTIKDILAEAEQLWLSGSGGADNKEKKDKMVQWDRARFEDLVNDFTASVDTLYDLSRARGAAMRTPSKDGSSGSYKAATAAAASSRSFEPTRINTPQVIDPAQLTEIPPAQTQLPPGTDASAQPAVVLMSKTAYADMARGRTLAPWGPLLLEYAPFDAIYAATGIAPPMARFERLSAGLSTHPPPQSRWSGLPLLLGYFEDLERARFGLVYRLPAPLDARVLDAYRRAATHDMRSLRVLLEDPAREPPLEAKFRLARNIAGTVFDMHARGVTHGKLAADNVLFCDEEAAAEGVLPLNAAVDVRRPLISSFDVFSEPKTSESQRSSVLHVADERVLELQALSVLLLSVGLWMNVERLPSDDAGIASAMALLEVKCGGLYAKAVRTCGEAMGTGGEDREAALVQVQMRIGRFLETCCILDGVSGWEKRLDADMKEEARQSSDAKHKHDIAQPSSQPQALAPEDATTHGVREAQPAKPAAKEHKLRLYSQVPLPAEAVEKWNTILMPQINQALRHFYRKHPESVEISLESIGLSPQQTEPTVLVVCSSVGKVRAILNKRVGGLFDGSTGFALRVCRGHVVRSRAARRSMATSTHDDDGELVEAVNPQYQERPGNGASIGAWIGDRHLPPVSFGGLVVVDGRTYGMTVHHMLDDPDRDDLGGQGAQRSAAYRDAAQYDESTDDGDDDDDGYELSDTESEAYSDTDITSDYGDDDSDDDDDDDEEAAEPGDIPGVEPGCGDGYVVTQPALDDVEEGFYPCTETEDEDHLATFRLGAVYASSGIRRRRDPHRGLVHEVDWALFEFAPDRLPDDQPGCGQPQQPTVLAPSAALPGKHVRCVARTSGSRQGLILPALCSVRIYGRVSPSHAHQVASTEPSSSGSRAMGIPGDSGAWVVGAEDDGDLCGHVLAWSARKRVAYICPMDVLLLDVARTLGAREVRLPGGEPVVVLEEEEEEEAEEEAEQVRGEVVLPRAMGGGAAARSLAREVADVTMGVKGIDVRS